MAVSPNLTRNRPKRSRTMKYGYRCPSMSKALRFLAREHIQGYTKLQEGPDVPCKASLNKANIDSGSYHIYIYMYSSPPAPAYIYICIHLCFSFFLGGGGGVEGEGACYKEQNIHDTRSGICGPKP